jgi:ribosomal protein S18 acetylase RimI-like enzyme
MEVFEIPAERARRFYGQWRKPDDHLSFSDKGRFFATLSTATEEFAGIVSAQTIGDSIRIKTLMVRPSDRRRGHGTAMLSKLVIDGVRYTAFATDQSRPLFEKFGFAVKSTKANGISYMVKDA